MTKEVSAREFFSAAIPDYQRALDERAKLVEVLREIGEAP